MFVPIEPIPAFAPRQGLRRAAQEVRDGARWESGFAWRPERCPVARTFDPCAGNVSEVQVVTITGVPTGGTFTLTNQAQTTAGIPFDAVGTTVRTSLEALSNLAPGDVAVTGGASGPYTVTFRPSMGPVPQMTASGAGLTGGVAPAVNVTTTTQGSTAYGDLHGEGGDGQVYHRPVGFRVERTCTTLGGDVQVDQAAVRRQADAITSFEMARELWSGIRTQLNPYDLPEGGQDVNQFLASGDATIIPGGYEPLDALGVIEEAAREGNLGLDVMIHVPLQVMALVSDHLVKVGDLFYTANGAAVVADAGYDGTSPEGAEEEGRRWIYATSTVAFRLTEINTEELINHNTNKRTVTAERLFAAYFDPCTHYGLAVVVPTPAADPA